MNVFFKSSLNWHSFYSPLRTSVATEVKATLISLIKIKRGTSDLIIKDEMFSRRQIFPCLSFVSDFTCMHSLECLFFFFVSNPEPFLEPFLFSFWIKIKLVIRDSQVLAKLGVVTIFFIGWWGEGGGYNRWQQIITGDLLLLPSNGHGRKALRSQGILRFQDGGSFWLKYGRDLNGYSKIRFPIEDWNLQFHH